MHFLNYKVFKDHGSITVKMSVLK